MSTEEEVRRVRDLKVTTKVLGTTLLIGLLFVALRFIPAYLWRGNSPWVVTGQTLVALLWSLAWTAAGFVFGFLFGIPRVIQGDPTGPSGQQKPSSTQTATSYEMRVNTNLEEISDWLTKLIVGATLTQLVKIPGYVFTAAHFMARDTGDTGTSFAAAILLFFSAVGFLCGYIVTRMFLSGAFALADSNRLPQGSEAVVKAASLPGSDGEEIAPADPSVAKATAELAGVPISDALTADQANTLARSALLSKDPARALRAASVAVSRDSSNALAQLNYAVALSMMNAESPLVLDRLAKAHALLSDSLDATAREQFFNTLIYTALYQDPPLGFESALKYGQEFIAKAQPADASIWINLACAYGQNYAWVATHPNPDTQILSDITAKAIFAIRQAISKNPTAAQRLRQLADSSSYDNDLYALSRDSAEVRQLLKLQDPT